MSNEDIKKFYKFLGHENESELRLIKPRWKDEPKQPVTIFVKNEAEFVNAIKKYDGQLNIYVGINERSIGGNKDDDISTITCIGHDIDAHDGGVDSIAISKACADWIRKDMLARGYKEPLVLCSGRGYWVLHKVPGIPNTHDNVKRIKEFGRLMKEKYELKGIEMDSTVYNPSRIARVPGTMNVSDKENFTQSHIISLPEDCTDIKLQKEILNIDVRPKTVNPSYDKVDKNKDCPFLNYCLMHEVPSGERHKVISRNMSLYLYDHPLKEDLKVQYGRAQQGSEAELNTWLASIEKNGVENFPFSCGEMINFQKKYRIPLKCRGCPKFRKYLSEKKSEESAKELNEIQRKDYSELQKEVFTSLALRDRDAATELIVKEIENDNHIYTTRDDVKSEMWIYKEGVYVPQGKSFVREFSRKILEQAYTTQLSNAIVSKIETDTFIEHDDFFNTNIIDEVPLMNGILNIRTRELSSHTPDKIFFNKLPVKYDEAEDCPSIKQHFESTLKDKESVDVMMEIFGYLLLKEYKIEKAMMFIGYGRNGKCQKGTDKVMMEDGRWKEIQNVIPGEKVISPQKDGTSKTCKIVNVHNRFEEDVYDVREKTRDKKILYTCAGNHIIPIMRTYSKRTSKDDSTPRKRERRLFEYDAKHISKLDNSRSQICSFTTTAIEYNQPNANINPYCLGAWLGDGHFRSIRVKVKDWNGMKRKGDRFSHNGNHLRQNLGITSMDKEIVDEFYENYPNDNIRKTTKPNNKASTYNLSVIGKLAKELTKLGLNGKNSGDKFIPKECLLSSIDYRKNLLAGLIDTDGFVQKGTGATYYVTKSKQLSEDIKDLVFSIGGYCKINNITKKCQNGFTGDYFELSIQLKDYDIPLRLKRKSCRFSNKKCSPRNVAIECIKTYPQQVYGIEIEGDSKWYITNDWMVTHNSKTIELMKRFVGAENCSSLPLRSLTEESFSLSELFGKMANLAADLSKTDLKETGMVKSLIGRDTIQAHRKYLRDLNFVNYAKMVFAANELPKIYDTTDGFWTKWVLLEFPYKFVTKEVYEDSEEKSMLKIMDPDIIEKLTKEEELSGLLNFALDGLDRLMDKKDFSYSKSTADVKDMWIRKSDSFTAFCYDHVEEAEYENVTKKQLRKFYHKYTKIHRVGSCSDKAIHITLENMYGVCSSQNSMYERVWDGIKLKNVEVLLKK